MTAGPHPNPAAAMAFRVLSRDTSARACRVLRVPGEYRARAVPALWPVLCDAGTFCQTVDGTLYVVLPPRRRRGPT